MESCTASFGHTLRTLDAGAIRLRETCYPSHARLGRHAHPTPQLCLVLEGGYLDEVDGSRLDCATGTLAFHGADVMHANEFYGDGARCLNVALDVDALELGLVMDRIGAAAVVHHGLASRAATDLVRELEIEDDLSPVATEGLVTALLCDLARGAGFRFSAGRQAPAWLERVRRRLADEFALGLSLAELADDESVHRTHVSRAFKDHYGCTVGEYVRQRRVEYAARQLRETRVPIGRIAYAAGFSDQSHMNRTFRKIMGMTPRRYRESCC